MGKVSAINYDTIASDVMISGVLNLTKSGVMYRKGKSADDIRKARVKALKHGRQKIETELSMMALYLKDILKAAP